MTPLTPETLGFVPEGDGWRKLVGGRELRFRRLHAWHELEECERLQREVFGMQERDLIAASILVVIPKTGGQILGALDGDRLVGYLHAWGGFVAGRPRLVSDLMAVEPGYRGGLGFALKSLQAALALAGGYQEIVWTVDPLRAANARLNIERLGGWAGEYLRDLYGDFAEGLYGNLPSDRVVVTWPIASRRVHERLLGGYRPLAPDALDDLPDWEVRGPALPEARVALPGDIDALLARDPGAALAWRLRLRDALEDAFARGYAITGFAGAQGRAVGYYRLGPRPE